LISPETGAERKGAKRIPSESAARIMVELNGKYPIEKFSDYNELEGLHSIREASSAHRYRPIELYIS